MIFLAMRKVQPGSDMRHCSGESRVGKLSEMMSAEGRKRVANPQCLAQEQPQGQPEPAKHGQWMLGASVPLFVLIAGH